MIHIQTRAGAWAAAMDSANRRMMKYKRSTWNRADYNHACRVLDRLMPDPCRD
jgi:hypothetical protein